MQVIEKRSFLSCCCSSLGELELHASTDKACYLVNEKCILTVYINTQGLKAELTRIKIKLMARIQLISKHGHYGYFEVCAHFWN